MKKQIALIIISILATMSVSAQNVNQNEMCKIHTRTPICEMGPGVIQPNLECIFGGCLDIPDVELKPEIPEEPIVPDNPTIPDVPEVPDAPEVPDIPDTPVIPDVPEIEIPDVEVPDVEVPENDLAMKVFNLVNSERAKYGLASLTYDALLSNAANIRAVEIKNLFSHTRPDGRQCFTALDEVGYNYRTAGENIAYGQRTPEEVMNAWMNSEGHRKNILGSYSHIGIGVYEKGGTIYWSQFFAS